MPPQQMSITAVVAAAATLVAFSHVSAQPHENAVQALLKFKTALANADPALANWDASTPPCSGNSGNWAGVLCYNGYVWGLQLESMGLQGQIDVDSLAGLQGLRTLSFSNNNFQGTMPDWRKLPHLKSLYLHGNQFSGQINNDAFAGMALKNVYLSDNKFTGPIPASLTSPSTVDVQLENNRFSGAIPAVNSPSLQVFNVSNNQLQGPVPPSLLKMDPSCFSGNKALCGSPGGQPCDPSKPPPDLEPLLHSPAPPGDASAQAPPPNPPKKSGLRSYPAKIAIIILNILLGFFLILLLLLLCWRTQIGDSESPPHEYRSDMSSPSPFSDSKSHLPMAAPVVASPRAGFIGGKGELHQQQPAVKLSFVKDDRRKFDLQDLMRASAEVLGSGKFGASYRAVLVDGEALVVKRYKQMNAIAKEEFHEHMKRLGGFKHPNLLPLVAYLYRKEEKLLVFDFMSNNSLAMHLHDDGKRTEDWPKPLNWPCRLKIIKGVAKGLAYLYTELPNLTVPHSHLKSSNVLIDDNYNARLMDYTLGPVVNPAQICDALVAYKCPEYAQTGRTSKKSDVWCLGILIMETLTAKPVTNYLSQGSEFYGVDLARWVNGIVEEARNKSSQVFDKEMEITTHHSRPEIEKLLQIGIACTQEDHFHMIEAPQVKHPCTSRASGNKNAD